MGRGEPGRNGRADDGSEIAVLIQKREREEGDGGGQRGRTGAARNKKMTATSTETERVLSERVLSQTQGGPRNYTVLTHRAHTRATVWYPSYQRKRAPLSNEETGD